METSAGLSLWSHDTALLGTSKSRAQLLSAPGAALADYCTMEAQSIDIPEHGACCASANCTYATCTHAVKHDEADAGRQAHMVNITMQPMEQQLLGCSHTKQGCMLGAWAF